MADELRSVSESEAEQAQDAISRLVAERDALREQLQAVRETLDEKESELEEVHLSRRTAEAELEEMNAPVLDVLRAVRDWFDNVLLHKRPMSDPRVMLRQVERALQAGG